MLQAPMIEPRGHQPVAALGLMAEFGGLVPTPTTAKLAVAGTGKDVVLMATGVKFSDRAKPPH